ncbi:phage tail tape measure protein [Cognatishimia sp. MH4019]|uniref:phage tail tape measure protein n=1 Tax=Cognatishimia sp. MH4019 TaxID=2854030 RepID=UPI001CD524B6|nr:phage tail tape measure protein [Cognatishimia sp. MH4019]
MIPTSVGVDVLVSLQNALTAPLRSAEDTVAKATDRMQKRLNLSLKLAGGGAVATGVALGAKRMVTGFTDSIRDVERAKGELATLGVRDLDAVVRRGQEMQMQLAGVTADAFVRASYDIKSGISSLTDQGVADMTASAMLVAKATKGQAEQMTSLFATSYGIFKKQMGDLTDAEFGEQFGAALSASVQQFKTDGAAMQQAIESTGAGAVNLGMDMTEQLTLLGMMQQQMQAGEAGTALRAFATNAAKAHEAFGKMQVSADRPVRVRILDENGGLRDMPDILADLQARYGETLDAFEAAEIKEAFGTDEAMKMINALYGQEAAVRANADALDDAAQKGSEFTSVMAAAADNNWDATMVLMSQKMDVITQKIGERLLPVVQRLVPYIDAFIATAFDWIDANPELITGIGGVVVGLGALAAVIAPILIGAGALVSGWAMMSFGATKLVLSLAGMAKWVLGAGKGLLWLGRAVLPLVGKAVIFLGRALIANPIGLIIAAIAGAAYLIYKNWEPIAGFFSDVWGRVTDAVSSAWSYMQGLFDRYNPRDMITNAWQGVAGFFGRLWDRIKGGVSAGWELIKSTFLNYHPVGLILSNWDSLAETFAGYWESIRSGVNAGWSAIKMALAQYGPSGVIYLAWGGLSDWFAGLWERVKMTFVTAWASIKAEVASWPAQMKVYGEQIIQKLIDGIKSKIAALAAVVSEALSKLNPFSGVNINVGGTTGSSDRRRRRGGPVQERAGGGSFGPGWLLTGELGPELEYRTEGGFIAHNRALRNMLDMATRTRDLVSGIGFDGFTGASMPAMATVAAAGGSSMQRGPITFAPQYNMPLTFEAGTDLDEVRATVRAELSEAEDRALAELRGLLHD